MSYLTHLEVSNPSHDQIVIRPEDVKETYLVLNWHIKGQVYLVEAYDNEAIIQPTDTAADLFSYHVIRKWLIDELTMITYDTYALNFRLTFRERSYNWNTKVQEKMDIFLLNLITVCSKYTRRNRPKLSGINAFELEHKLRKSKSPLKLVENTQSNPESSLRRIELGDTPAGPKRVEDLDRPGNSLNKKGLFFQSYHPRYCEPPFRFACYFYGSTESKGIHIRCNNI